MPIYSTMLVVIQLSVYYNLLCHLMQYPEEDNNGLVCQYYYRKKKNNNYPVSNSDAHLRDTASLCRYNYNLVDYLPKMPSPLWHLIMKKVQSPFERR